MEREVDYWADPCHPAEVDVVGNPFAEDDLCTWRDRGAWGWSGSVD